MGSIDDKYDKLERQGKLSPMINVDPSPFLVKFGRRQDAAEILEQHEVDGVFFDARFEYVAGTGEMRVVGYLYEDRKGRFEDGVEVFSSCIQDLGIVTVLGGEKAVKVTTLNSVYISLPVTPNVPGFIEGYSDEPS